MDQSISLARHRNKQTDESFHISRNAGKAASGGTPALRTVEGVRGGLVGGLGAAHAAVAAVSREEEDC